MGPAPIVQALVFALVDGDSEEPGGELGVASEVPRRSIGTQEYILGDLFSEGPLPELSQADGVDTVLVPLDKVTEGRCIALLYATHQLLVCRSSQDSEYQTKQHGCSALDLAGFHS